MVYLLGGVSEPVVAGAVELLINKTVTSLGVHPYFIAMGGTPATAPKLVSAFSRYVVQSNPKKLAGMPYATGIAEPEAAIWESVKAAGAKLMPSVTPGRHVGPTDKSGICMANNHGSVGWFRWYPCLLFNAHSAVGCIALNPWVCWSESVSGC